MEPCIFHGTLYRPSVCKRCQYITGSDKDLVIRVKQDDYERLERVVSICRHTGREKISFRRKETT